MDFGLILRFDGSDEDDDVQTIEEVVLEGGSGFEILIAIREIERKKKP